MNDKITFTRIDNDSNGNPRIVCSYLVFVSDKDFGDVYKATDAENKEYTNRMLKSKHAYDLAVKKAKKIGGKKYNTKKYGGGIVFQSYNITDTEKAIHELLNN